jgi:glycosyltransferase involved in cell wall biosynthesis
MGKEEVIILRICMLMYRGIPQSFRRVVIAESIYKKYKSVDVLCIKQKGQNKNINPGGATYYRLPISYNKRSNKIVQISKFIFFMIFSFIKLFKLNIKNKYQIIHVHNPPDFIVLSAIPFKIFSNTKIILDLHDMLPEAVSSNFEVDENHIFVRIARLIERLAIKCSDAIICTNTYDKEIILSRNIIDPEKIFIVMNTPDTELFKIEHLRKEDFKLENKFVILFEGTIWKRRGIQTVIEAVEKLKDKIPIYFVILGDGPDLEYFKNIVNDKNLNAFIEFTGWVDLKTLSEYISISDVCLIPFLKTKVNERGVPNKLFEYIVHDKPVIASRLTGMSLTLSDKEVLFFEPGNATDLAEKILWVYNNPKEIEKMVNNAKQRYEKEYTWDKMEKELYKCYESVV